MFVEAMHTDEETSNKSHQIPFLQEEARVVVEPQVLPEIESVKVIV